MRRLTIIAVLAMAPSVFAGEINAVLTPEEPAIDLTAEGTTDWVVWGLGTDTSLFSSVRKAGGAGISPLQQIMPQGIPLRALGQFNQNFVMSWSDGDPTETGTNVQGGLQHNGDQAGALGAGFSLTVPAGPDPRQLTLYVTSHNGLTQLTASLSDGSAADGVAQLDGLGATNAPGVFTIEYSADSPSQTLTVDVVLIDETAASWSNVAIYAATLESFVGACCTKALACTPDIGINDCIGTYMGNGTTCTTAPNGGSACDCNDNGMLDIEELDAGDCNANTILDACEVPDPSISGACCHSDGTCSAATAATCNAPGDSFGGLCTTCSTICNDDCALAQPVATGDHFFDTTAATTDGPPHADCQFDGQTYTDIWFKHVAEFGGPLKVSTCDQADYDSDIVVYAGCDCPVSDDTLVACNDDAAGCTGFSSEVIFEASTGACYLIRVGSWDADTGGGTGTLTIECGSEELNDCIPCEEQGVCPPGAVGDPFEPHDTPGSCACDCCSVVCVSDEFCCEEEWDGACVDLAIEFCPPDTTCDVVEECTGTITSALPASNTIDARQPHDIGSSTPRQGIGSTDEPIQLTIDGTSISIDCFSLCETVEDGLLGPNNIAEVIDHGGGLIHVILDHAITAGGVTRITYADGSSVAYTAHPGNVDGNSQTGPLDLLILIDGLNGVAEPPLTNLQCDINRTGICEPLDILRLIDLLNGADTFEPWSDTLLPDGGVCP